MRSLTLDDVGRPLPVLFLSKLELAALCSLADKNPRSQWVWVDVGKVTAWSAAGSRVLRASGAAVGPSILGRASTKDLKAAKPLKDDLVGVAFPHPDVAELVVLRAEKPEKGKKARLPDPKDGMPPLDCAHLVDRVRLSVPPLADTDYRTPQLDATLATGGSTVPLCAINAAHLDVLPKVAAVAGKQVCDMRILPGGGDCPVVWEMTHDGILWTYGVMTKRDNSLPAGQPLANIRARPSQYQALNDASRLAHAQLTGSSPKPEDPSSTRRGGGK